jgi:hypothetical protein
MGGQLHGPAVEFIQILQHQEDGTKRLHHRIFTIFETASDD